MNKTEKQIKEVLISKLDKDFSTIIELNNNELKLTLKFIEFRIGALISPAKITLVDMNNLTEKEQISTRYLDTIQPYIVDIIEKPISKELDVITRDLDSILYNMTHYTKTYSKHEKVHYSLKSKEQLCFDTVDFTNEHKGEFIIEIERV